MPALIILIVVLAVVALLFFKKQYKASRRHLDAESESSYLDIVERTAKMVKSNKLRQQKLEEEV